MSDDDVVGMKTPHKAITPEPLTREQMGTNECFSQGAIPPDLSVPQDPNEYIRQLRAQLEAVTKERDEAVKTRIGYDEWLKGGVYFTTDEFDAHESNHRNVITKLQKQLATIQQAAQEAGRALNDCLLYMKWRNPKDVDYDGLIVYGGKDGHSISFRNIERNIEAVAALRQAWVKV